MHNSINTCGAPWCIGNMHHKNVDEDGVPYGPVYHCIKWMKANIDEFKTWEIDNSTLPF
jgi:hypothetical protein